MQVTIHLLAPTLMAEIYAAYKEPAAKARELQRAGAYTLVNFPVAAVSDNVEDVAEEIFDLTNNPCRQEEREDRYGRGRSLSVGDIVQVGEKQLLCCSFGWQQL